jgi:hypothetical protein
MVRHTHRRRQSRGRRRNMRRSRRTQRGGGWWPFGSKDVAQLRNDLNNEKDEVKRAEIQKDITCTEAEEKLELLKKSIKDRVANGAAISSTSGTSLNRNSAGQFQSSANTGAAAGYGNGAANSMGMGMGTAASSSMFGGRRRRSHRRR